MCQIFSPSYAGVNVTPKQYLPPISTLSGLFFAIFTAAAATAGHHIVDSTVVLSHSLYHCGQQQQAVQLQTTSYIAAAQGAQASYYTALMSMHCHCQVMCSARALCQVISDPCCH